MKKRLESLAADIVFNRPVELVVKGRTFTFPRPTMATLIAASEVIAELPARKMNMKKMTTESMAIAPYTKPVGRVAAILLLGVSNSKSAFKKAAWRRKVRRYGDELMRTLTPEEMQDLIFKVLEEAKVGHFFGLTTSLLEVNLLRRTVAEEVEK